MKLPGATHLVILSREITPRLEGFVSEKIEQWLGLKINRDKTRIYEVKTSENGLARKFHHGSKKVAKSFS